MDTIGTSHIAVADLLIWIITLALIAGLWKLPQQSIWSVVVAILSGSLIIAIILLLLLSRLNDKAVQELSYVGLLLCWILWDWSHERRKANVAKLSQSVPENDHGGHSNCR